MPCYLLQRSNQKGKRLFSQSQILRSRPNYAKKILDHCLWPVQSSSWVSTRYRVAILVQTAGTLCPAMYLKIFTGT